MTEPSPDTRTLAPRTPTAGHIGTVVHGLRMLKPRWAPMAALGLCLFFGGAACVLWAFILIAMTRPHPTRSGERGFARLVRLSVLPTALLFLTPLSVVVLAVVADGGGAAPSATTVLVGAALVALVQLLPALSLKWTKKHLSRLTSSPRLLGPLRRAATVALLPAALPLVAGGLVLAGLWPDGLHTGDWRILALGMLDFVAGLVAGLFLFQAAVRLAKLPAPTDAQRTPERLLEWVEALEQDAGLVLRRRDGAWVGDGEVDGRAVELILDTATWPARVEITMELPELGARWPALELRARREGTAPGPVTLPDPILGRLVRAEGLDQADAEALLGDLHEEVLAVLQAWPESELAHGQLILRADAWPGEPPGGRGPELPELLATARTLAGAVETRSAPAPSPARA